MLIITSETHIIILIDAEKCLLKVNISYDKKKKTPNKWGRKEADTALQRHRSPIFFLNNKKCIGSGNWEAQEVI